MWESVTGVTVPPEVSKIQVTPPLRMMITQLLVMLERFLSPIMASSQLVANCGQLCPLFGGQRDHSWCPPTTPSAPHPYVAARVTSDTGYTL